MIKQIRVPKNKGQRYYQTHFRFLIELARGAGIQVEQYPSMWNGRGFVIEYNEARAHIDFGDHGEVADDLDRVDLCFRYHFLKKHEGIVGFFPLTPISFYDWGHYWRMTRVIKYQAGSDLVLNNQKPGKAAKERRDRVQRLLKKTYGRHADLSITDKEKFWLKIGSCLVSVCVPGARNDILDRGQLQYMALGACTISPPLDITLPYWRKPEMGIDYIACKPDYSDLIDQIEKCRVIRGRCVEIGRSAQKLFQETCTPQQVWRWVNKCTEGSI